jgi:hypothetical protein
MAMSKKELADVADLRARLAQATALRDLTLHVPPQVPLDNAGGSTVHGGIWWANPYHVLTLIGGPCGGSVHACVGPGLRRGCSSHATSVDSTGLRATCWVQGPGVFYYSRKHALLAVRDAVVQRFAATLAAVDAELAREV